MALSRTAYTPKQVQGQKVRCYIYTVEPKKRLLEGRLRDGGVIRIMAWDIPPSFRWPKVGEVWSVFMENGYWHLGSRVVTPTENEFAPEDMGLGHMRLDSPSDTIFDSTGNSLVGVDINQAGYHDLVVRGFDGWDTKNIGQLITGGDLPIASLTQLGLIMLGGDLAGSGSSGFGPLISELAITEQKLAHFAVTSDKLFDGAVLNSKLADAAVTTTKIGDREITGVKIGNGEIVAQHIYANTITANQIAAHTITADEIEAHTITSDQIYVGQLDALKINAGQIQAISIQAAVGGFGGVFVGGVLAGEIDAGAISVGALAAGVIDAEMIIGEGVIATSAGNPRIQIGKTDTGELAIRGSDPSGNVTFNLDATTGSLSLSGQVHAGLGSGGLGNIGGQLTSSQISITTSSAFPNTFLVGSLAAGNIAGGSIYGDRIVAGSITTDQLAAGTITADNISVGMIGDNVILNPSFEVANGDGTAASGTWMATGTGGTGYSWSLVDDPLVTATDGNNVLRLGSASNNSAIYVGSKPMPVNPGENYTVRVKARGFSATSAGCYIRLRQWSSKPSDQASNINLLGTFDLVANGPFTNGWTTYQRVYTPGNGVYWVSLVLANVNSNKTAYFDEAEFRKQLKGVHIQDDAISAGQISADAITAKHTLAGPTIDGALIKTGAPSGGGRIVLNSSGSSSFGHGGLTGLFALDGGDTIRSYMPMTGGLDISTGTGAQTGLVIISGGTTATGDTGLDSLGQANRQVRWINPDPSSRPSSLNNSLVSSIGGLRYPAGTNQLWMTTPTPDQSAQIWFYSKATNSTAELGANVPIASGGGLRSTDSPTVFRNHQGFSNFVQTTVTRHMRILGQFNVTVSSLASGGSVNPEVTITDGIDGPNGDNFDLTNAGGFVPVGAIHYGSGGSSGQAKVGWAYTLGSTNSKIEFTFHNNGSSSVTFTFYFYVIVGG